MQGRVEVGENVNAPEEHFNSSEGASSEGASIDGEMDRDLALKWVNVEWMEWGNLGTK